MSPAGETPCSRHQALHAASFIAAVAITASAEPRDYFQLSRTLNLTVGPLTYGRLGWVGDSRVSKGTTLLDLLAQRLGKWAIRPSVQDMGEFIHRDLKYYLTRINIPRSELYHTASYFYKLLHSSE